MQSKLLKELALLSSKEAALRLKIYEKYEEIVSRIIGLGALITVCEIKNPEKGKLLRNKYLPFFNKYIKK
jgi:hypothetical protein